MAGNVIQHHQPVVRARTRRWGRIPELHGRSLQFFQHLKGLQRHSGTGILKAERRIVLRQGSKDLYHPREPRQPAAMALITNGVSL